MSESDDYGFFCDLENTKTMYYEYAEYYLIPKYYNLEVTHWEVRRKYIEKPNIDTECRVRRPTANNIGPVSVQSSYNSHYPRPDMYYSFLVCIITVASVYLIMII